MAKQLFSDHEFVLAWLEVHANGGSFQTFLRKMAEKVGRDLSDQKAKAGFYNLLMQRRRAINERLEKQGYNQVLPVFSGSEHASKDMGSISDLLSRHAGQVIQ